MPIKNLRCAHCGKKIPDTHSVYKYKNRYAAVLAGKQNVFCSRGHAIAWRHANTDFQDAIKAGFPKPWKPPAYDLRCLQCGELLSPDHMAYSKRNCYEKAKDGRRKTFCCPSHASMYSNARRDPEVNARIGAARRRPIPKYDLTCNYCGVLLPKTHKVYRVISGYNAVKAGKRRVYCCASHAQLHIHANRTEEEKAKRSAKLKKSIARNDSVALRHETRKQNGSYKVSKPELEVGRYLSFLFPNLVHQYRDHPDYPFAADFYDPDSDTVFEYQGFMSHGHEPYNKKLKAHRKKVRELEAESHKWLPALTLKIWTKVDPKKRRAAKKNGINFVEWFNLEQFYDWYWAELGKKFKADNVKGSAFRFGDKRLCWALNPDHDGFKAKYPDLVTLYPWENPVKVISWLKPKSVLYARKLEVAVIDKKRADAFCEKFHIQGKCKGTTLAVGLLFDSKLVGVMTFGAPRYNKHYDHELLRLCYSKTVIGGTERMWKLALSKLEGTIISYCDLSKFSGAIYTKLGFRSLKRKSPSIHWYNPATGRHITDNLLRQRGFDQLVGNALGVTYGKGTVNAMLMRRHGFRSIADQGQQTFVFER